MQARRLVLTMLLLGGFLLLTTAVASAVTGQSVGEFTRDTATLCAEAGSKLPFYAGSISVLNEMVWPSVACLAMLVAALVPARRLWLLAFSGFNLFLAADDSLMLHERVGPGHHLPELTFYVIYALFAAFLLGGLRHRLRDAVTVPFALGGVLLAGSIFLDQIDLDIYLLEDGLKLLGSFVWLTVAPLALPPGAIRALRAEPSTG